MKTIVTTICAIVVMSVAAMPSFGTMVYTDEPTFQGVIQSGYYLEDFHAYDGIWQQLAQSVNYGPTNGYQYTASAIGSNTLFAAGPNNNGALTTNLETDTIRITFTGDPVTATGGLFYPSDYNGSPITNSTVVVGLDDNTSVTLTNAGSAFLGFTSSVPIAWLEVSAPGQHDGSQVYPTVDHLYVGAVVPEPGTLTLLSLAGLSGLAMVWIRRRRLSG
jgi:hypothetical protein